MSRLRLLLIAALFATATATVWAALLGVVPGVPSTTYSTPGSTTYDASTHLFTVTATPTAESFGSPIGTKGIAAPRGLTINILVDNTGALIGGAAGNDLTLTGSIDINGDNVPDYSGVLLTGEVVQFGSQNLSGTTDQYDFRFRVTGGALAPLYGTNDIGVRLTSENSTFNGSFTTNFTGRAKGTIGLIPPLGGEIGDFVWQDTNRDGIQNPGEPGIAGVTVRLKDAGGSILQTDVTDAAGGYLFGNLPAGLYTVEIDATTIPPGLLPSPLYQGGNPAADSDPTPQTVSLLAGEANHTIDFGFYPPCSGAIGNIVWNDLDRDGIQDAGEPGINGVTVELLDASMTVIRTTTTALGPLNQNGYYQFTGVCAGTYYVRVNLATVPPGFTASPTEAGFDTTVDSNPQNTLVVLATDSAIDNTIDFGYYPPASGNIGNFVWNDLNRDGIQNTGEPGIEGVVILLRDPVTNAILQTTTTTTDGYYEFDGLAAGSYRVEVDLSTLPAGFVASGTERGGDAALDSNPNGWIVTLPTDSSSDVTIDFGYNSPCSGVIGDRVWHDANGNGVQDAGEPGLVGVTVQLLDAATNTVLQTTMTGAGGVYMFNGVCAGAYEVRVDESTLPPGFAPSPSLQGGNTGADSNGSPATVTLPSDSSIDLTIDFGYTSPCAGMIGNFVWNDLDGDGIQDAGEPGIDGVTLNLYDASYTRVAQAITSGGGAYLFTGLCAGAYTVAVEPRTVPAGMSPSPTLQGGNTAADSNGVPTSVTLATDTSIDLSIDFGYFADAPAITLVKSTNGQDADTPPGPTVAPGSLVTWTYVVTNTGNVPLTNVAVTDDQGVSVICPKTTLAPGEQMTCTATGTAVTGQYANIGTATGTPPTGPAVTASNPSHYFGSVAAIAIVKYTNGADADLPPGPSIQTGDPVLWTYNVTNTGNVTLTDVAVSDSRGVAVTCPKTVLAAGENMICTGSGIATLGQYENVGTVTGTPPTGGAVSATNPSHYVGVPPPPPGLAIVKTASPTSAAPFQPVTYTYTVTNTGGTTLTNIVVTDDNGTPGMPDDDFVVGTIASLAPGASASLTATTLPIVSTQTTVNGVTYQTGAVVVIKKLADGNLQVTYIQDFGINDNTYGTGAIGWPGGHKFNDLVGSDKLEFRFYDKNGNVVLDFYQDYISAVTPSTTYPAGYASLCASGGDGSMVSGSVANIVSCTSSLAENLNDPLNVPKKASLIVNSPTSLVGGQVVVNTTAAPGGWDYINRYTVVIDGATFGPGGLADFGSVAIPDQHNSPSKLGVNSITTEPKDSTVTNIATAFADANTNQTPDAGEIQGTGTATVSIVAQPSSLSGFVYLDAANDGSRIGDAPIAGVTVTLTGTNIAGPVSMTTVTDANGFYQFNTLMAGTYTIAETQPGAPYLDGVDTIGSLGGTASPNDTFAAIALPSNTHGVEYNFGERQAGMLAGAVYVDADNDGMKDAGETALGGVTVRLFSGTTLVQTTTTDAAGTYRFSGMAPGTYTIVETQPAGYLDGRDTIGTGLTMPGTVASDVFSGIGVVASEAGSGYNFGEVLASAAATSTVSKVFTKTALTSGSTLWFSSAFRASGLTTTGQGDVTLRMVNAFITITPKGGVPYTIPTPDATIVFKNTLAGGATTTFDAASNTWLTTLQKGTSNDWFLNALPYQIPSSPSLTEATFAWTGTFITDTTGVDVSAWKAAAAAYNVATPAPANYNAIGVKPTDNATVLYPNTDQAGVPENWKASFVANTGTGGSTQPGAYTANGNPTTQVLLTPDPTETFATTPVIYP